MLQILKNIKNNCKKIRKCQIYFVSLYKYQKMIAKNNNSQVDINKNILDFEIFQEREDYVKKVNTPGTIEYKLYHKYKHTTLTKFLKYISNE